MSTPKTLVLTRPATSSARLLAQVEKAMGENLASVMSPVLQIVPISEWPDLSGFDAVVISSIHAIQGRLDGKLVFCVGERTANAATEAGGTVLKAAQDADALVAWMERQSNPGTLVFLRGSHTAVDIRAALAAHSITCVEIQTYRQEYLPLSPVAQKTLEGERPAILPLFSPRSARLVGGAIAQPGRNLHVIAMSDAVAKSWHGATGGKCEVAQKPTGDAMVSSIVAALQS